MLVRTQSSALLKNYRSGPLPGLIGQRAALIPDVVTDRIGPSEGPGPGSTPGRDTLRFALRVCRQHGSLRSCKTRFDSSAGNKSVGATGVAPTDALARRFS